MTTKTNKKKKQNVQDATLKNTRPLKKRIEILEMGIRILYQWIENLDNRLEEKDARK